MKQTIGEKTLDCFRRQLRLDERRLGTVEKYVRDAEEFSCWLEDRKLTKAAVENWRDRLLATGLKAGTVNGKLAAVNSLLKLLGREDCRVKALKVQHRAFRDPERELTQEEFERLVETAQSLGRERLALLLETICSTGIRVSEVRFITVEAIDRGAATVDNKGKTRTVLLPGKLCRKLKKYARQEKISAGEIFITSTGKSMSRRQIWAEMKALCKWANVNPSKVFPHNLRHLFATVFYRVCRDIARLADVLGHASIETTRIYLLTSGKEHRQTLDRLKLVS